MTISISILRSPPCAGHIVTACAYIVSVLIVTTRVGTVLTTPLSLGWEGEISHVDVLSGVLVMG